MQRAHDFGFTLIEAVIAIAVMVTIVATVAHVVLMAAGQSTDARRDLRAVVLAQSKLEELRASPSTPIGGADAVDGVARRWHVAPVNGGDATLLLMRVCIDSASTCVATVRAVRP